MKYISKIVIGLLGMSLTTITLANQVQYTVNKPMIVGYQIAHQNANQPPVLGTKQTMEIAHTATIAVQLSGYQFAGVITNSIDGHELPASIQRFDDGCSVRTDQQQTTGTLELKSEPHKISCRHS